MTLTEQTLDKQDGKKKRVAVIGGGVSGIVTTKWLVQEGHQVKTFEQSSAVGGNWRYIGPESSTDNTNADSEHSSCYKNLKSITSTSYMSFEGHRMPKNYGKYPHHTKIFKYLSDYCNINGLWNYFILNTKVTAVRQTEGGYNVTYITGGIEQTESFDAVAICNGHNSQPYWPKELMAGLEHYTGNVIHSRAYRDPEQFQGQNVLILGGGISGRQISYDVSSKASYVALSSRRNVRGSEIYRGKPGWHALAKFTRSEVEVLPALGIAPFSEKTVRFANGYERDFDAIIVCTGYKNSFPFLDQDTINSIVRLPPRTENPAYLYLFKHTFPVFSSACPTMAFIGMMDVADSSMFYVADVQAKWFAELLSEKTTLPAPCKMQVETDKWKNMIEINYHPMVINSPTLFYEDVQRVTDQNKPKI